MKRGTANKFRQLRAILITWMILGFIIAVYDHLVLNTHNSLGTSPEYSFMVSAIRNVGAGIIGALIGGSILVFYVNVRYQDKPYGFTILLVFVSFIFVVGIVTLIMAMLIVPIELHRSLFDSVTIAAMIKFMADSHPLKSGVVWSLIVAVTQLMLQVSSKFGQGSFGDIIRGKYHVPKQERRVFMFLDMNSSTTIAEQLGNETYHRLLRDFFADITNPILDNGGNIYQYVGDEVVVSWEYEDGIKNASCINCFFDMKDQIDKHKERYMRRYGLVPAFKAGIHCGDVVAGEVGVIKRDITYSGDVLNTTSRIQSLCRELNEEIIASADVVASLILPARFSTHSLGSIKLRGKEKELALSTFLIAN